MTIRVKILGGFILITLIGLMPCAVGLMSARIFTGLSNDLYALQKEDIGVSDVLNAHYIWRQDLIESVMSETEFKGSIDPYTCALGQWKDSGEARNITDPEIITLLNRIDGPHSLIHNKAKEIKDMLQAGDSERAEQELQEIILPSTQEVITVLTDMEAKYSERLEEKSAEIIRFGAFITTIVILLIIVVITTCILLTWRITASIMNPLRKITSAAELIAAGNLDAQVNYGVNDQIGMLAKSFQNLADSTRNQASVAEALAAGDLSVAIKPRSDKDVVNISLSRMVNNLRNMFSEIRSSAEQVSVSSKHIADGAQYLAQGASEQSSAIEALSASISEVSHKTSLNADMAQKAVKLSGIIEEDAEKGNLQMDQLVWSVKEINEASSQIGEINRVIDEIALQTNLLALNAAVEAARAGAAGSGFAVVAEEVRILATKSAEAAKDAGKLVENSIEKANLGLSIATETSASLREIVDGIGQNAEIVAQIARSSDEQALFITRINAMIDQVSQVVQENCATAEENAAASEEMSGQSNILEQLVSQVKLK